MDAACRVKSDRGYTMAALDDLQEELAYFFPGQARSNAQNKTSR